MDSVAAAAVASMHYRQPLGTGWLGYFRAPRLGSLGPSRIRLRAFHGGLGPAAVRRIDSHNATPSGGWHMFLFAKLAVFFIACAVGLVLDWLVLKRVVAFINDLGSMWSEET